ncbi:MAG: S41 family peptidase [Candidatus Omnitrophota bacterium]
MRKVLIFCLLALGIVLIFNSQAVISEEKHSSPPAGVTAEVKTEKQEGAASEDDFYEEIELFTDALTLIRSEYVEDAKYKDLIYGALKGMLVSLDPYSQFLDPDDYKEVKVETEGEFGGLGIQIAIKDGLLTVISPIDDTPAFRAGLKAGDRIVKIEGELTRDITLIDAVKKLRGTPGTKVSITILREGTEKLMDFTISRDIIKIKSIRYAKLFEDKIGYIRISEFQERTPQQLEEALNQLEELGMEGLLLDLRNNPGGLLDSAVRVTEKFIPAGEIIVSTHGRFTKQDMVFRSAKKSKHRTYPLIVLISKGSASGSEIVAGAIQDYKRGILLGTQSFGKGSVQTVVPLRDGSALRLTTSKYFTPSGRCIHGKGITPDVVVEFEEKEAVKEEKDAKAEGIFEQIEKKQEVKQEESKKEDKKEDLSQKTEVSLQDFMTELGYYDNQLVRASDLLKGIKLYITQVAESSDKEKIETTK